MYRLRPNDIKYKTRKSYFESFIAVVKEKNFNLIFAFLLSLFFVLWCCFLLDPQKEGLLFLFSPTYFLFMLHFEVLDHQDKNHHLVKDT